MIELYMYKRTVKKCATWQWKISLSALEHVPKKVLTYVGMLDKERIARIGSNDPESHLGIPYSHVSANSYFITFYHMVVWYSNYYHLTNICRDFHVQLVQFWMVPRTSYPSYHKLSLKRNSSRTLCSISNGTGYLLPSEGTYLQYIMYCRYWISTYYCIFWNLVSGIWII
jgi:hypothetical protein